MIYHNTYIIYTTNINQQVNVIYVIHCLIEPTYI